MMGGMGQVVCGLPHPGLYFYTCECLSGITKL